MFNKPCCTTLLAALLLTCITPALAEEAAKDCRLRGGSMVSLAAAACTMEGGSPIVTTVTVTAAQLSAEPQLAAAQRVVLEILNKPVVEITAHKDNPERVKRTAKFDECSLQVDELIDVDHGNLFTNRKHLKLHSVVNLKNIDAKSVGDMGAVESLGGGLKTYALALTKSKRDAADDFSISVLEQKNDAEKKFTMPGPIAFWGTRNEDLWMADVYGYPLGGNYGDIATDKIRVLYLVATANEVTLLKKALEDAHALCKRQ